MKIKRRGANLERREKNFIIRIHHTHEHVNLFFNRKEFKCAKFKQID